MRTILRKEDLTVPIDSRRKNAFLNQEITNGFSGTFSNVKSHIGVKPYTIV